MKKEILMLAVLTMSAACTEISVPNKVDSGEYRTIYFTSEKPVTGDETKTYYDPVSNGILWESGDKIIIALSNSAELEQDTYTGVDVPSRVWGKAYLYSAPAAISDEGKTAKFALTENESCPFPTTSGKYRFHALYPFSALFAYGNVSIWDWGVSVGTTADNKGQYPTATSYDPNMDIMLGISQKEYDGINSKITDGEDIPMVFDRLVTHGKITVTNIPEDMTEITKAVIKGPEGCTMSGIYYINVLGKEFGGDDKANLNYVILNYNSSGSNADAVKSTVPLGQVVDGQFDLWFCTKPIEIAAGQPLTISLYNEEGCLSRQITAREGGIKFEKNKLSTLTVSMKDMPYSEYSYQLLKEPDGEPLEDNVLDLPRTAGVTEFYVRTNAGNSVSFSFSCEELPNIISINEIYGSSYIDDEGWNVIKCKVIHKENHSTTEEIRGSINVRASLYGELKELSLLTIAQTEGRGNVVIGDWTGDYVEMAGLLWYPCNLGFDLDHPFGKYYQWGRKDGQYPYFEDKENVKFAESKFDETGKITEVDTNTYYYNDGNWFRNNNITAEFAWPTVDDDQFKGMGNPCPNGWRLPTSAEWQTLNNLFNKNSDIKHTDKLHGIASFESKTTTGMAAVWEACDNNTGASLEFSMSGYLAVWDSEDFKTKVNNNFMCRFDYYNLLGTYWASDILSSNYSYNQFEAIYTNNNCEALKSSSYQWDPLVRTSDGCSYYGRSVRCVQDIAAK